MQNNIYKRNSYHNYFWIIVLFFSLNSCSNFRKSVHSNSDDRFLIGNVKYDSQTVVSFNFIFSNKVRYFRKFYLNNYYVGKEVLFADHSSHYFHKQITYNLQGKRNCKKLESVFSKASKLILYDDNGRKKEKVVTYYIKVERKRRKEKF